MAEPAKSQSIPLGNNQDTTAKGRNLVIHSKQEGVKVARILIDDTSGQAPIRIPLTRQLESVLRDEVLEEWPTIAIPVRFTRKVQIDPQPCYPDNIDKIKRLNTGFIYIFINGVLWRELQVQRERFVQFSDVALDRIDIEKKPDNRAATGHLETRVILPIQIEGKPMTVEIGYSAVQWSWARVESMGGISPEGVARDEWFPDEHGVNSKGKKLREERLQNLVDLRKCYDQKFNITIGDIGPVDTCNLYEFKIDYGKKIANIALDDLIQDARDLASTYQQTWQDLKDYISDISNADNIKTYPFAPWFDSAVLANQYFFVEQPEIKADGVNSKAPKIQKIDGQKEKQLKIAKQQRAKWKKSLSLVDIQKALGTDKREELRQKIKEAKDTLADFLAKDSKHINKLVAQIDDYSTLPPVTYDCPRDDDNADLSKLEDCDISFLYKLSNELFAQLADHEFTIDRTLETKPKTAAEIVTIKKQDKGRILLTQLVTLSAGHPLTKRLFPPEITDITQDTTKNLPLDEPNFTSKRFLKTSRRAIKFISKFITEFEKIASPKAVNIENTIVNLVTKTKIAPNLKKITITLEDFVNHNISSGQFEKYEILSNKFKTVDTHLQKSGIPTGFNDKQGIQIHDLKGNLVGSSSMDNMINGKVFTERYWKILKDGKGKTTTWQKQQIEVWALAPEKQSNVERYSKKAMDSGVWTRGILPILTMLEVWNFGNVLSQYSKKKEGTIEYEKATKNLLNAGISVFSMGVTIAKARMDYTHALRETALNPLSKLELTRLRGDALKYVDLEKSKLHKFLGGFSRFMGATGGSFSAYLSIQDMIENAAEGDDAAIANGVMAAGFSITLVSDIAALVLLTETAATSSFAGTLVVMGGPMAWVGLAVIFAGAALLQWVFTEDTQLEEWLTSGPFSISGANNIVSQKNFGNKDAYTNYSWYGAMFSITTESSVLKNFRPDGINPRFTMDQNTKIITDTNTGKAVGQVGKPFNTAQIQDTSQRFSGKEKFQIWQDHPKTAYDALFSIIYTPQVNLYLEFKKKKNINIGGKLLPNYDCEVELTVFCPKYIQDKSLLFVKLWYQDLNTRSWKQVINEINVFTGTESGPRTMKLTTTLHRHHKVKVEVYLDLYGDEKVRLPATAPILDKPKESTAISKTKPALLTSPVKPITIIQSVGRNPGVKAG